MPYVDIGAPYVLDSGNRCSRNFAALSTGYLRRSVIDADLGSSSTDDPMVSIGRHRAHVNELERPTRALLAAGTNSVSRRDLLAVASVLGSPPQEPGQCGDTPGLYGEQLQNVTAR